MKKNEIFTFTAPNGVEVTGVVVYRQKIAEHFHRRSLQCSVTYIKYEYVAYAQNRLFTCTQMERVIDRENYNACPIEYGHVLVEYCIIPEYDKMLEDYQHQLDIANDCADKIL